MCILSSFDALTFQSTLVNVAAAAVAMIKLEMQDFKSQNCFSICYSPKRRIEF